MDAVKFLREQVRMCENNDCSTCELHKNNNKTNVNCYSLANEHPDKAVAIVEGWSKKHPQKTIKDDFLEKYPGAETYDEGIPTNTILRLERGIKMDKFIEIQVNRELTPKGDQFLLINVNYISAIGEMDGYATIGLAGEEGVITCENSYEEVKRKVLNERV